MIFHKLFTGEMIVDLQSSKVFIIAEGNSLSWDNIETTIADHYEMLFCGEKCVILRSKKGN